MYKLNVYHELKNKKFPLPSIKEGGLTRDLFFFKNVDKYSLRYFFYQKYVISFLNKQLLNFYDNELELEKTLAFLKMPMAHANKFVDLYFLVKNKKVLNKSLELISGDEAVLKVLKNYRTYLSLHLNDFNNESTIIGKVSLLHFLEKGLTVNESFKFSLDFFYRSMPVNKVLEKRAVRSIKNDLDNVDFYDSILYNQIENICVSIWTPVKSKFINFKKPWLQGDLNYYDKVVFNILRFSLIYFWVLRELTGKGTDLFEHSYKVRKFMFLKKVLDNFWEANLLLHDITLDNKLDTLFFSFKNSMKIFQSKNKSRNYSSMKKKFEFMVYLYHMLVLLKKAETWTPLKVKKVLKRYMYRSRGERSKWMWALIKGLSKYNGGKYNLYLSDRFGKSLEKIKNDKHFEKRQRQLIEEQAIAEGKLNSVRIASEKKGRKWVDFKKRNQKSLYFKERKLSTLQYWGFNWRYKNIGSLKKNPEVYTSLKKDPEVVGMIEADGEIYKYTEAYLTLRKTYSNLFLQVAVFDEFTHNEKIFFVESLGQAAGFGNKKFKNKKKKRNVELLKLMVIDAMRKMASYGIRKIIIRNVDKLFFYQRKTLKYMLRRGGFNIVAQEFIFKKPHGKGLRKKKLRRL